DPVSHTQTDPVITDKIIVINEIDLGVPDAVEIYNAGLESVNLSGWKIKTGDNLRILNFNLPSLVISPGEYILFVESSAFSGYVSSYDLGTSAEGRENINWSRSTAGAVEIIDPSNNISDHIEWENYEPMITSETNWSGGTVYLPHSGSTLGRDINSTDTNSALDIIPLIGTLGSINNKNPIIIHTEIDAAIANAQYESHISFAAPSGSFTLEVVSGSFPAGLSINSEGNIYGMPQNPGEYAFNIRITDDQIPPQSALATLSMNIFGNVPAFSKNFLVVNGVSWDTYGSEIRNAYNARAFWGNLDIDFWDVFETPSGGYPLSLPAPLGHGEVPFEILGDYSTVIWIGNSYEGDLEIWKESPIFGYVKFGGNLILMTRRAGDFISEKFREYIGITWAETDVEISNCIANYPGLTNIIVNSNNTYNDIFTANISDSESRLLFVETASFGSPRGLGVWKQPAGGGTYNQQGGQVVLLMFRPYRVNSGNLSQNIEYIVNNMLYK
ncbi:lamin tail domain-containing protein, partial [candidate division KSB1 bacterium]